MGAQLAQKGVGFRALAFVGCMCGQCGPCEGRAFCNTGDMQESRSNTSPRYVIVRQEVKPLIELD